MPIATHAGFATTDHETPMGKLVARWSAEGLYSLNGEEPPVGPVGGRPAIGTFEDVGASENLQRLIDKYFATGVSSFESLAVDPEGWTEFQRNVYAACREIPSGETTTYGDLARRVGSPGASRAVGAAMAANRVLLVIPCHRVVAANGQLRGFSAPGGLVTKQRLLDLEGHDGPLFYRSR